MLNDISFGSTYIPKGRNPHFALLHNTMKLIKSGKFNDVKPLMSLENANLKLKPGQVGVISEGDRFIFTAQKAKEDELIYNVLTNNGKKRIPGSTYVTDILDISLN